MGEKIILMAFVNQMNLKQLKDSATRLNVKNRSGMNKNALAKAVAKKAKAEAQASHLLQNILGLDKNQDLVFLFPKGKITKHPSRVRTIKTPSDIVTYLSFEPKDSTVWHLRDVAGKLGVVIVDTK
jgi:phosphotransferase system IIB component